VFDTFQIPYSALERAHETVITAVAQVGAGTIIRGGVARGAPEEGGLGQRDRWALWEQAKLEELLTPGESRSAFLLRFTLTHPDLHTTIAGTMNPNHLAENLRVAETGPLPPDVYAEAKRRLAAVSEQPADG
jgi:aryl-alcohol dehydrogenase-like predicted oxidoreductase